MNCKKRKLIRQSQYYATLAMNLLELYRRDLVIKKHYMKAR